METQKIICIVFVSILLVLSLATLIMKLVKGPSFSWFNWRSNLSTALFFAIYVILLGYVLFALIS